MSEASIPHGWVLTAIGEFTTHRSGNSKLIKGLLSSLNEGGMFPAFSASGQDVWTTTAENSGEALIISAVGARCGKVFKAAGEWSAIANTHVVKLHPEATDFRFFHYLLNREHFWVKSGTAQPFVKVRATFERPFALPPLQEQKRIVAKIEELFSELDAGMSNLKKARAQLAVYRQALLKHAFEGKLTAEWRALHRPVATVQSEAPHPVDSWRFTTLGNLTEYITSGSRGWAEYYAESGPIFIRAANLNRDRLDLSEVAFVSLPAGVEGTRTQTRCGDVFVTITGANVTKSGYLDREIGESYVSQHVALCRPIDPTISEYLHLYIISNAGGRRDLEKAAYGAGKPGLNLDNLRTLQIPMPTRAEIPEIVAAIRSQLSEIDTLEADIDLNLQKAEALRQSILKKAFAGELVPQDPADEPAAVLLARLRAERETQAGAAAVAKTGKPRKIKVP
jgi:type I restriction enzyme S subunit